MKESYREIFELFLKSQLLIKKASQERLGKIQIDGPYHEPRRNLIAMLDAECEEIERQINSLSQTNLSEFITNTIIEKNN